MGKIKFVHCRTNSFAFEPHSNDQFPQRFFQNRHFRWAKSEVGLLYHQITTIHPHMCRKFSRFLSPALGNCCAVKFLLVFPGSVLEFVIVVMSNLGTRASIEQSGRTTKHLIQLQFSFASYKRENIISVCDSH